jgi:transposase
VTGAHAVLLRYKPARLDPWLMGLLRRRPRMVVAVAVANKMARIAWAIMSRNDSYRSATAAA